ncbi:MAG: metallophosphoesterase [Promethearchaeota archaeon]
MISEVVKIVQEYSVEEVLRLLERVQPLQHQEPRLLQLPKNPLLFVGDTHGDWESTQRLLTQFWHTPTVFVFLGDYVDRGPFQIENINLLLYLKTMAPNRLMLLRGNHETPSINRAYGFFDAVQFSLGDVISHYWKVFGDLPLAAISFQHKIFAVHGGIPEALNEVQDIDSLPREVEPVHPIAFQLLWNDPSETVKGFRSSMRGGRIRTFGQDITEEFMAKNKLDLIVRAHEVFPHGFHEYFDGRIMSLFSCREYRGPIAGKALYVASSGERKLVPV